MADLATLTFKEGDRLKRAFLATTMDKVLVLSTGGKVFTLEAAKLPGGRGHGEPVRLMLDMDKDQDVVGDLSVRPERQAHRWQARRVTGSAWRKASSWRTRERASRC